jgi:hypothetical protein
MAFTLTKISGPHTLGNRWENIWSAVPDNSYGTGGESLTRQELGFAATADPTFHVEIEDTGGYSFEYDHTNQKVKVTAPMRKMTGTFDAASLASVTARDEAITVTGVAATDEIPAYRGPDALEAKYILKGARATGVDTVTARADNHSAAAIDPASGTYVFYVMGPNCSGKEVPSLTDLSGLTIRIRATGRFLQ